MLDSLELADRSLDQELGDWLAQKPDAPVDRWSLYARLRREAPVLKRGDEVYLSRHADCIAVLRDNRNFLSGFDIENAQIAATMAGLDDERRRQYREILEHQLRWLTSSNGAKHVALRSLATRVFSARAIEDMRGRIAQEVEARLEALSVRPSIEVVSDIAYQLPLTIISEMLDIPVDVRESIHHSWQSMLKLIGQPVDRIPAAIEAAHEGMMELEHRLKRVMDLRRGGRTTDLVARLLAAQDETDGAITEREIVGIVSQMVIAGHQTTQDTICSALWELLTHRDQWRAVCADPALIPNTVEEVLRYRSPGQFMPRHAREDCVIGGVAVPAGARIVCLLGSANRDPEVFAEPERFDIRRENASQHIAFSSGMHFCLGASLSRMEVRSFLEVFARRFPDAALVHDQVEWLPSLMLLGVRSLDVRLR